MGPFNSCGHIAVLYSILATFIQSHRPGRSPDVDAQRLDYSQAVVALQDKLYTKIRIRLGETRAGHIECRRSIRNVRGYFRRQGR